MATSSRSDLAAGDPQITVGVAASLHGEHALLVLSRHAYKPVLRTQAFRLLPVAQGMREVARQVRRAVRRAHRLSPVVRVVVDVTATGRQAVEDIRAYARLGDVPVSGLVVGGGQAEPGGVGRWSGGTAPRAGLIYLIQQYLAAGQVHPVDDLGDRLALFRRKHEQQNAKDETAWNEDTTDVPGVAFGAAVHPWLPWHSVDVDRPERGTQEQLLADHPGCRSRTGRQDEPCCRNCGRCARRWQLPPPELRVDPGWCEYCVDHDLAPQQGGMSVHVPQGRIPRSGSEPRPPEGWQRMVDLDAEVRRAEREAFGGGGRRIGPRPWDPPR